VNTLATRDEISSGGVVCRRAESGGLEVALIATHGGERWALPKGLVKKGEALAETALREVREETGLTAEIVAELETVEYWFWWGQPGRKVRFHKKVHFFVMRFLSGDVADHDHEVDDAAWLTIDEAIGRASYKSERQLLEQVRAQAAFLLTGSSAADP
jgi:8-oxo-dGTP pyrophosphatase MutT (NUDIX family)